MVALRPGAFGVDVSVQADKMATITDSSIADDILVGRIMADGNMADGNPGAGEQSADAATSPRSRPEPGLEPVVPGRCFGDGDPLYSAYHDDEWGVVVHGDRALFERVSLEAFQSGLSWITILRRRDGFREAFHGFDPERVASMGDLDIERLLLDERIIRNRAKITATIGNARALLALHEADRTLDDVIWSHVPAAKPAPEKLENVPAWTPESKALAKELRSLGFKFIGPTTAYAMMQACGLVNDHMAGCPVRDRASS